jgi:hypothetical protein
MLDSMADEGAGGFGSALLPQHQRYLGERAVSPEVARERGYRSADTKAQLRRHGFSAAQADQVPALIIPSFNVFGEVVTFQCRPDEPRMVKGRVSKFELPYGARLSIDVPPRVLPLLRNIEVPLYFAEGPVKADAAASAGLACVALFGVSGWKTKTEFGSTAVSPELEYLALKGRRVFLAFDNDVLLKPLVYDALARLYAVLEYRGADVAVVLLPAGPHGEKTGLDDYFARGGTVDELSNYVSKHLPSPPRDTSAKPEPEPIVDENVTLADLLDATEQYVRRFIVFADAHQPAAIALWVAHAWFIDAFDMSPRLLVTAPVRRAAKSRVLDVVQRVVPRAERYGSASGPAIFRAIDQLHPTLLVDEIDRVFRHAGDDASADLVTQVINIGWERGNPVARVEGPDHEVRRYESFAATALAGIDKGALPETVVDRSVRIAMRRRHRGEPVEKFRRRGRAATNGDTIRRHWAGYLESHADLVTSLSGAYPELPDALHDRAQDAWEPLIAIADAAGDTWPARARDAAVALTEDEDDDGPAVQVLVDLREVWPEGEEVAATKTLIERLVEVEDSPWQTWGRGGKSLTGAGLARLLRPFGIRSEQISIVKHHDTRGYVRAHLEDAWARYAPARSSSSPGTPEQGVPTAPAGAPQGARVDSTSPGDDDAGTLRDGAEPLQDNGRDGWDASKPPPRADTRTRARPGQVNGTPGDCDSCLDHKDAVFECADGWLCADCIERPLP